jgi:hypothetical protein
MTIIHVFLASNTAGQPMDVSIIRLDDSDEFLICGPDDLEQASYPPSLRDATRQEPMALDDILTLAADIAVECERGAAV